MKNFFDQEKPIWKFVSKLVDCVILNVLWFVCCLPVVTFGAATNALYASMMLTVKDRNPQYVRNFFQTMKKNLRNGIPLGLVMLALGALLVYAALFYLINPDYSSQTPVRILEYLIFLALFLYLLIFQFVFALSARFENSVFRTLKNALILAVGYLLRTVVMAVVTLLPILIIYLTNFWPVLLLGFGFCVYLNAYILNPILDPILREAKIEQGLATREEIAEEVEAGKAEE